MKGKSCLTNLLSCQKSIVNMMDCGIPVDIIFLDFQKAFDKVPHGRLMAKIREIGVDQQLCSWIENWLSDRTQRVCIDGIYSDWAEVTSGVPQGSILGPLLFTIYINDLEQNVGNNILKFADDSKLWGAAETTLDRENMQNDLDTLGQWSNINQMPFNINKCKVMHIGRKNLKWDYKLNNQVIASTSEEKDLGVYIAENFKPSLNCSKASKAANKIIGLIKRNISDRSAEGMMILYKTLVRPIIDYCIPAWRPYLQKDITLLERIQKRFTKLIDGCKTKNYSERLDNCLVLPLLQIGITGWT